jgi:hypothetical protein
MGPYTHTTQEQSPPVPQMLPPDAVSKWQGWYLATMGCAACGNTTHKLGLAYLQSGSYCRPPATCGRLAGWRGARCHTHWCQQLLAAPGLGQLAAWALLPRDQYLRFGPLDLLLQLLLHVWMVLPRPPLLLLLLNRPPSVLAALPPPLLLQVVLCWGWWKGDQLLHTPRGLHAAGYQTTAQPLLQRTAHAPGPCSSANQQQKNAHSEQAIVQSDV